MAIVIQIREDCDCDDGQIYGIGAVMRECPLCDGKSYIEKYVPLSELWELLEEIKRRRADQ